MPTETTEENPAVHTGDGVSGIGALRVLVLVMLLTASPVWVALSPVTALLNGDIWWHLRTGLWILQHHAVPRSGLFSQYSSRPWVDSSWAFDTLVAAGYKLLGLKVFPVLLIFFKLLMAALTFLLAGGRRGNFWCAILLSAIAQYVIVDLLPLPILFSILFFGVALLLLLASRRSGDMRPLYYLPPLFFLWANLHGQFLSGLLLLVLYLVGVVIERLLHSYCVTSFSVCAQPLASVCAIGAFSAAATLMTPYLFQLFPSAFQAVYNRVLFESFQEMQALSFRRPQDFLLLFLVMAAFLALGRQRSRDLFKLATMCVFIMFAFRIQRDVWCVVFPAIAVIADAVADWHPQTEPLGRRGWKWEMPLVATFVLVVFVVAIIRIPSSKELMSQTSGVFPVRACDFIRANQLPGPLFNTYIWGGFLIWYLPEYPVIIDGRLNLYGNEINERYFRITSGAQRLETDPGFTGARIILLEHSSGMLRALTTLPVLQVQFRVAYQDDVATVLVRQ